MRPAAAKPFLFEQSFDEEAMQRARERKLQEKEEAKLAAERAEQEQAPPPPTFSEEELQSAQAAAWQEGHQAGMADAQKQQEAQTLAGLTGWELEEIREKIEFLGVADEEEERSWWDRLWN